MQEFNQQALEPAFQNQSKGCYTVFLARIMEDSPHTDLIRTIEELRRHPLVGSRCGLSNPQFEELRSWPVTGFEATRIYYLVDHDILRIIRILHGKRDVQGILQRESTV